MELTPQTLIRVRSKKDLALMVRFIKENRMVCDFGGPLDFLVRMEAERVFYELETEYKTIRQIRPEDKKFIIDEIESTLLHGDSRWLKMESNYSKEVAKDILRKGYYLENLKKK